MKKTSRIGFGAVLALAAVYFFVVQAARYNLAVTAGKEQPVAPVVVIDAGHGGEDGGATTDEGVTESTINLAIALRLEAMLAFSGVEPVMVRTTDTAIYSPDAGTFSQKKTSDLKNRVKLVNETPGAILVSIHQNHFSESRYSGAQVFYAAAPGSEALATCVQTTLRQTLDPGNNRQIKPGDAIYLLEEISCPGILVECGFLSNGQEAAKLQSGTYQTKIACAVTGAVMNYLKSEAMGA